MEVSRQHVFRRAHFDASAVYFFPFAGHLHRQVSPARFVVHPNPRLCVRPRRLVVVFRVLLSRGSSSFLSFPTHARTSASMFSLHLLRILSSRLSISSTSTFRFSPRTCFGGFGVHAHVRLPRAFRSVPGASQSSVLPLPSGTRQAAVRDDRVRHLHAPIRHVQCAELDRSTPHVLSHPRGSSHPQGGTGRGRETVLCGEGRMEGKRRGGRGVREGEVGEPRRGRRGDSLSGGIRWRWTRSHGPRWWTFASSCPRRRGTCHDMGHARGGWKGTGRMGTRTDGKLGRVPRRKDISRER